MKVLDWATLERGVDLPQEPIALSIGVFDGVHRGHRSLIELIHGFSEDTVATVLTFPDNPARRLRPQSYHGDLESYRFRLEKLEALGVGVVIAVEFNERFRSLSGEAFLDCLRAALALRYLAIGSNFRCGRDMQMGAHEVRRYLEGYGVRVDIAPPVVDNELQLPVSSTVIRRAVLDGDLERVRRLLGSEFEVDVATVPLLHHRSECRMRKHDCTQVLPYAGAFEVEFHCEGGSHRDIVTITENHVRWSWKCNDPNRIRFLRQLKSHEQ